MASRGVHFALDARTVRKLKGFTSEEDLLDYFEEELEEKFFANQGDWLQETDKAWDAIHRSLTDGKLEWENGTYPLNHAILGGELLCSCDDYILSLKSPKQVQDIAAGLEGVTKKRLKTGYDLIARKNCDWDPSPDDWKYTWSWFTPLVDFYQRAAKAKKSVIFSAAQ
jgi:hypothetical protein